MALDPHVFARLEDEFAEYERRRAYAQERIDALNEDIKAWQRTVDETTAAKQTINDALIALGVGPLT